MGGVNNALTWGVGATEYADLVHQGFTQVEVPESIRFELTGKLRPGVTAKDLMLYILLEPRPAPAHARPGDGVHRPRRRDPVDGRARHAHQHGDRVRRQDRHRRRRRRDLALARRVAAGGRHRAAQGPRRGARPRRRVRRRRPHHRPLDPAADGRPPGRPGPRHPVRPDERRLDRRDRRGADRHRLRRELHGGEDRRPDLLPPGGQGGARRRPQGRARASGS